MSFKPSTCAVCKKSTVTCRGTACSGNKPRPSTNDSSQMHQALGGGGGGSGKPKPVAGAGGAAAKPVTAPPSGGKAADPKPAAFVPNSQSIATLTGMGFNRTSVIAALTKHNGNLDLASDQLLSDPNAAAPEPSPTTAAAMSAAAAAAVSPVAVAAPRAIAAAAGGGDRSPAVNSLYSGASAGGAAGRDPRLAGSHPMSPANVPAAASGDVTMNTNGSGGVANTPVSGSSAVPMTTELPTPVAGGSGGGLPGVTGSGVASRMEVDAAASAAAAAAAGIPPGGKPIPSSIAVASPSMNNSASAAAAAAALQAGATSPMTSPARPSTVGAAAAGAKTDAKTGSLLHRTPRIYDPAYVESSFKKLHLGEGSYVDVRDTVGKWLEGHVVTVKHDQAFIHYLQWDSTWDEWIPLKEASRFADFHQYSGDSRTHPYKLNTVVDIYPPKPTPQKWRTGIVTQVDAQYGSQVQVSYDDDHKPPNKYQYWFPVVSDEMHVHRKPGEKVVKNEKEWYIGKMIEAQDPYKKWFLSEVVDVDEPGKRVKVHYDGFAKKWDEWLHIVKDAARLRPMGSTDPKSREQMLKEEQEKAFRAALLKQNLEIVDMDKDGNCLFRCFAHQIYGDPERHPEVRAACCDYEDQNRDYFCNFVDGDFDVFLAKRRLDAWGDHTEIAALRELYNKNVTIFSEGKPARVLARDDVTVPTVLLAYHGGSHYNSVTPVPSTAFKPFGDGSDSKVSMRQLRIDDEKRAPGASTAAVAAAAAATAATGTGASATAASPAAAASASTAPAITLDEKEVAKLWAKFDREKKGVIRFAFLGDVIRAALELIVEKKKAQRRAAGKECESIDKAKHEIPIESIVNRYNELRVEGLLKFDAFRGRFAKETLPDLVMRMSRMD